MSKQVRCINPRNYRLTRGNEYTVTNVAGRRGYYNVVNDSGRSVQYTSELFEDIETRTTNDEILESLNTRITADNVILTFNVDGEDRRIQVRKLTESGTNISCGIRQLYGVNPFVTTLVNNMNDLNDRDDLIQRIINAVFSNVLENVHTSGMMLLSTNVNDTHFNRTNEALTPLSATTYETLNPNSDNTIKLWVIDVSGTFEEPDDPNTE